MSNFIECTTTSLETVISELADNPDGRVYDVHAEAFLIQDAL